MSLRPRLAISAALIALAASACAHRPAIPHRTPLHVLRSEGAVVPLIDATVDGHPIKLLVDTGAPSSILPIGFVRKFQVPFRSSVANPRMVDANRTLVSLGRAFGLPVTFGGEASTEPIDFLVNPTDRSDEVGLLAPQDLIQSGWAMVMDFPRGELSYEPEKDARARLDTPGAPLVELDYGSCELDNHRVVSVAINGVKSRMMIDTGAARTALWRNNEAIETMYGRLGTKGTVHAIASKGERFEVDDIPVQFAGKSFVIPVWVVPVSSNCGRGTVGADVLASCVMVWGSSRIWASCHPAAATPSN